MTLSIASSRSDGFGQHARDRVLHRLPLLGLLALGDVDDRSDHAGDLAARRAYVALR